MKDPVAAAVSKADYCFIMDDDSMVNAHIFPGDLVFISKCDVPQSGKTMAVMLNGTVEIRRVWITPAGDVVFAPGGSGESIVRQADDMADIRIFGVATETRHSLEEEYQ